MNRIVFTAWHKVIVTTNGDREDIPETKFLAEMNRNIKTDDYRVLYNPKEVSFAITFRGEDYQVIIPSNVKASIIKRKPVPLALTLKKLATMESKYTSEKIAKNNYLDRIAKIENSGYDALETTEDYEFYLKYLQDQSKKVKTVAKKHLIDTKINGLLKVLTNPYNLENHFKKFIVEIAEKGEDLKEERKKELEAILHGITDDYYKEIISKKDEMLVLGSSTKPMSIIRRIVDTEALVQEWLNENVKKNLKEEEVKVVEEQDDFFENELDEITEGLQEYIGGRTR